MQVYSKSLAYRHIYATNNMYIMSRKTTEEITIPADWGHKLENVKNPFPLKETYVSPTAKPECRRILALPSLNVQQTHRLQLIPYSRT